MDRPRCYLWSPLLLALVLNLFQLGTSSDVRLLKRRQAPGQTNDTTAQEIGDIVSLLGPRNEVDFVAILQRNQGMGKRNFYTGIRPSMEALMVQYATLHPSYVRSAVITFSSNVYITYDHISNGSDAMTKCEIFGGGDRLWDKVVYDNDNDIGTNIGQALNTTIAILTKGKQNRPNAIQVILVITDGDSSVTDDPLPFLPKLQKEMQVKMFAAGLGAWFKPVSVSGLASKLSYYGQLYTQWQPLLSTNRSSVGSDMNPLLSRLSGSDVCSFSGSNCTDVTSACYCDVDTGVTGCRCDAGYRHLQSSSPFQCQECSADTYRSDLDDDGTCLPCSPGYGTNQNPDGTTDTSQGCQCKSGNNCTADQCAEENNPCTGHEICSVNTTTDGVTCPCRPGWTIPTCSINPNDCSTQCLNGATCYDKVDGIQCVCPLGFRGDRCEIDEDYCAFDICVKNNTESCQSPGNNYLCTCIAGWKGDFCENQDLNPIQSSTITPSSALPPPSTSSSSSSSSSSSVQSNPPPSTTTSFVGVTSNPAGNSSLSPISGESHGKDEGGINVNLIIIIVCVVGGVLLILLLVLAIVIATSRRRNRRREEQESSTAEGDGVKVRARRSDTFQTPRMYGVRATGNRLSQTISNQFSGLWKKWTVRTHDPSEWFHAGVPSVPKRRPGLDEISDPHLVDIDETILKNEVIMVDARLSGWNSYLQELEKSGIIDGGIIAETVAHDCAKTENWRIDWKELEDLEKVMDSPKSQTTVKVQGQTYHIQANDGTMATGVSESGANGNSTNSSSTKSSSHSLTLTDGNMLMVGVTKCYLVAAVTGSRDNGKFHKEMQWVVDHITAEGY